NRVKATSAIAAIIFYCAAIWFVYGNFIVTGTAVFTDHPTENRQAAFEYSYPPFAYYLNPEPSGPVASITLFSKKEHQERVSASLQRSLSRIILTGYVQYLET